MKTIAKTILCFLLTISTLPITAYAEENQLEELKQSYKRPLSIPFPKDAPYSPQIATLGKKLFFDSRLSKSKGISCASCHNPSFGYEAPVALAIGAHHKPLNRHAPTLLNIAWVKPYFWDGRAETLEQQATGPLTAPAEMNSKFKELIPTLSAIKEYQHWFTRLFPKRGITRETILQAIATYERTIVSEWSPFDRWIDGKGSAITQKAKKGFNLFNGKAGCANCHTGWNFTDNKFHDLGSPSKDIGRYLLEPENPKAKFAYKTPGLRNLTQRAPFSHDGAINNLEDIIRHYETGGIDRPSRSPFMKPFKLSNDERSDLILFLVSLTGEKSNNPIPVLPTN